MIASFGSRTCRGLLISSAATVVYLAVASASLTFAQRLPCDQHAVVNVRNSGGEFVPDLSPSSFRAKIGGHEASVTSADIFEGSTRLVLVLDASGSMGSDRGKRRWDAIKSLTEQIVIFAPPSTKLALLVFATDVTRRLDFSHSRKELLATIEQLPDAKGRTSLWHSLVEASDIFGPAAPGDAVLVISDFGDSSYPRWLNGSIDYGTTPDDVRRAFITRRLRLFGIQISDRVAITQEEIEGPTDFLDVTKQTGGNVFKDIDASDKDLSIFSKRVFDQVGRFYVLKITPSAPMAKPGRLNLDLVAPDGRKEKRIALAYPEHLPACSP